MPDWSVVLPDGVLSGFVTLKGSEGGEAQNKQSRLKQWATVGDDE